MKRTLAVIAVLLMLLTVTILAETGTLLDWAEDNHKTEEVVPGSADSMGGAS